MLFNATVSQLSSDIRRDRQSPVSIVISCRFLTPRTPWHSHRRQMASALVLSSALIHSCPVPLATLPLRHVEFSNYTRIIADTTSASVGWLLLSIARIRRWRNTHRGDNVFMSMSTRVKMYSKCVHKMHLLTPYSVTYGIAEASDRSQVRI